MDRIIRRKTTGFIRDSFGDKIFLIGIYLFLIIVLLTILVPLLHIVSASFSNPMDVTSGKVWIWPVNPTLLGYKAVFDNNQIWWGYWNSIVYTVLGTVISVVLTVMIAYPLSRKTFYGRNVLMILIAFTMLFSGGLIPLYLVVKSLNMVDTRWALLLPQALAVWQIIIARTFFQTTIPDELAEAAELDGCSDMGFLIKIVLPLSKPIIAVMVLMYAVGQWNAYFDALIYLKSQSLFPLQLVLRNILILNTETGNNSNLQEMLARQGMKDLMKYSLIVVASLPVLIIYPFVQKHFVKGMMIGSIKG
ncbi:carbohydrate ABC transporter permease [Paenibacillus sp. NPDC056579]|uniref:carbohydrate ABC transporter permease n=1 Tax=unclassified Paenibacillus TaxID=185978 RepID=UPI001EF82022|nr:carbohydrate ABC transporter permease [Paenibacillus sp. H1-7]